MTDIAVRKLDGRPLTTYAQFVADLAEGKPDAGVVYAQVNLKTIMGGFVRFYGNEAEQAACARYRALWDASQVGGSRAVDPSREAVDGGWANPEAVFEVGADARRLYAELTQYLGRVNTASLHFVVVGEWGPTSYARWRFGVRHPNSTHVSRGKAQVRSIAQAAAEFLQLSGVVRGSAKIRVAGDPPGVFTGQVSSRA